MDKKQIKQLQENYSKQEIEEMIKPDEKLSASERLRQSIKNKRLRRSGLHALKHNLQEQMSFNQLKTEMKKQQSKSNLELLLESVNTASLRKMKSKKVDVSDEEYARCLSILNEYLQVNTSVNNITQIPEFEKIEKDNIRNIVHKIVYYDKYMNAEQEIEL